MRGTEALLVALVPAWSVEVATTSTAQAQRDHTPQLVAFDRHAIGVTLMPGRRLTPEFSCERVK
jgi:hypothetical protein